MTDVTPLRRAVRQGSGLKRLGGTWGECLAEGLGTFVLISFGNGVVAMAVAGLPGSERTESPTTFFLGAGDWLLITWGWALAVAFGVYVAGGVSGAHLNPAVTLAFAVRRGFAWRKVAPYMGSQVVGAFLGAALVYLVYYDAIDAYNAAVGATRSSAGGNTTFSIFGTVPAPYFEGAIAGPLIDQVVGTAFLIVFVAAVVDLRNQAVRANLGPLLVGLVVAAIGMSFGANAGYAINPARDFGPRLFAFFAGWGEVALPGTVPGAFSWYFWIPIVGPLVGGVVGVLIYDWFIGDVLHARSALQASDDAFDAPRHRADETDPLASEE
ncbi:MIP family channel protein [Rhodococcus sp. X156]|uniref:MIP/aquaporin family protein n=1 Tax=Rhodococcus sp. X156 TaxID=2499145 RepID=UPI000FDB52AA|nr:MIP family channel protein [Rhodococcus sp. X156]